LARRRAPALLQERAILEHYGVLGATPGSWSSASSDEESGTCAEDKLARRRVPALPKVDRVSVGILSIVAWWPRPNSASPALQDRARSGARRGPAASSGGRLGGPAAATVKVQLRTCSVRLLVAPPRSSSLGPLSPPLASPPLVITPVTREPHTAARFCPLGPSVPAHVHIRVHVRWGLNCVGVGGFQVSSGWIITISYSFEKVHSLPHLWNLNKTLSATTLVDWLHRTSLLERSANVVRRTPWLMVRSMQTQLALARRCQAYVQAICPCLDWFSPLRYRIAYHTWLFLCLLASELVLHKTSESNS